MAAASFPALSAVSPVAAGLPSTPSESSVQGPGKSSGDSSFTQASVTSSFGFFIMPRKTGGCSWFWADFDLVLMRRPLASKPCLRWYCAYAFSRAAWRAARDSWYFSMAAWRLAKICSVIAWMRRCLSSISFRASSSRARRWVMRWKASDHIRERRARLAWRWTSCGFIRLGGTRRGER